MSEITNAEINKKAAEIAGHEKVGPCKVVGEDDRVYYDANNIYPDMPVRNKPTVFDIFTSAADREAAAIALMTKHNIEFVGQSSGELWYEIQSNHFVSELFETYPEVIAAAVQAVK